MEQPQTIAKRFASQYKDVCGLVRIVYRRPNTGNVSVREFVVAQGQVARADTLGSSDISSIYSANGMCRVCGEVYTDRKIHFYAIGAHKVEACERCAEQHGFQRISTYKPRPYAVEYNRHGKLPDYTIDMTREGGA